MAGCGGGGSSSTLFSNSISGQFIDGPVAGLTYECSSGKVGITDENGRFVCEANDYITFKIGDITIGSTEVNQTITPYTLYPGNEEAAVNVAQLLQSLDDDGDLNRFVLDESKIVKLKKDIDFSIPAENFEIEISNQLETEVVSRQKVMEHMRQSIATHIAEQEKEDVADFSDDSQNLKNDTDIAAIYDDTSADPVLDDFQAESSNYNNSDNDEQSAGPVYSDAVQSTTESAGIEETPLVNSDVVTVEVSTGNDECRPGTAMQEGKVVDIDTKEPLVGVKVTLNGCTTTTDELGRYMFSNIEPSERVNVEFELDGYYHGSTVIQVNEFSTGTVVASPNYLEFALAAYDKKDSFNSQTEYFLNIEGDASVFFPAGIFNTQQNTLYEGDVYVQAAYEDVSTDKGKHVFPGEFEGLSANGETVPFVSYGMIVVNVEDANGNELKFADTATVTFPAVPATTQETIPMWWFDERSEMWIEKGYATKQSDGTYAGEISQSGIWSLSEPVLETPGIYRGQIIYSTGNPVRDARVYAVGPNWIRADLSTDENGYFEIEVVPGEDFTLEATNYKWKYSAKYNGSIAGVASGEIVENRK